MYTQNTTNHIEISYVFVYGICKYVQQKHCMAYTKISAVGLYNN